MTDDPLVIGVILLLLGLMLNIASPHLSAELGTNLGLWGGLFAILGLVIIAFRLRNMATA